MGIKYDDIEDESLGIRLLSVNMGSPEPYLTKTEIPGKNGVLDQSEAISGFTTYAEREVEMMYSLMAGSEQDYQEKMGKIRNTLHGKKRKVVLPSDPEFYYDTRLLIEEAPENSLFSEITILGTAYPYKRKIKDTVIQKTLTGVATAIECNNLSEPVVPIIEVSAAMEIVFGGKSFEVKAGKHTLNIVFLAGKNVLTVTGTGNIKITYKEGSL